MARQVLTDDSGKWFDDAKAVTFGESTRWDGNNHISRATGSQWDHQVLYYTRSGNWVLNCWSQYQGVLETYEVISEDAAIDWLISQERWDDDGLEKLPAGVQASVQAGIEAAEL